MIAEPEIETDVTFNMHMRTRVPQPRIQVTEALLRSLIVQLGYTLDFDTLEWETEENSFSFKVYICSNDNPQGGWWWLLLQSDERDEAEQLDQMIVEVRWITDIQDTTEGETFEDVLGYYNFAKTIVTRLHFSLARL